MRVENPNSKRKNPFRDVYDNIEFTTVLQHKKNLPEFPYLVDVELTNNCNLKCIFCGQQAMTREKGFLSDETFKKVIDECSLYKTPIRFIRFGEPFLHVKIINFCKYVKSKGLPLHITTNGLLIKEDQMKSLMELGLDSIIFSFQGANKEQYEIMRQNNQYDKLKANILRLVKLRGDKLKPFIHISSTVTNESKKDINDFVDYWVNIVDEVGIGNTNLSQLSAHQIKSFESIGKLELLKKQETIKKEYAPCTEVYQKLSVDWDGKVTCCCGDFNNLLTVGNVSDTTLHDIWNNSNKLKTFRELLDNNAHRSLALCSTCFHTYEEF
jgi:radical SAM protein with 4Fe4S-binding SPASM domain